MSAPFVGRHREVDQLTTLTRRARADRAPAAALVKGEPGSGKTRLRSSAPRSSPWIAGPRSASGPIGTNTIGPAWYGLETAHHGADSGVPGKGDGCYMADGSPALGQDDQNPAIR